MNNIKQFLYTQLFKQSIIGVLINPFYIARVNLYKNIKFLSLKVPKTGKLLDVGCGSKPYQSFFKGTEYIGLEIESSINLSKGNADFFYDGGTFPFEAKTFDIILVNQVLEHVFNPYEFLSNINRTLKDEGKLLLTVPFVWDEHEQPFDFARYSSFGLTHILKENGFEIEYAIKSTNGFDVILQLINAYIYKVSRIYLKSLFFICMPLFTFNNIIGIILNFIFPKNEDLFLDNVILARKIKNNG